MTHILCIEVVDTVTASFNLGNIIQFVIVLTLTCISAGALYHFIEVPGAKMIHRLMEDK